MTSLLFLLHFARLGHKKRSRLRQVENCLRTASYQWCYQSYDSGTFGCLVFWLRSPPRIIQRCKGTNIIWNAQQWQTHFIHFIRFLTLYNYISFWKRFGIRDRKNLFFEIRRICFFFSLFSFLSYFSSLCHFLLFIISFRLFLLSYLSQNLAFYTLKGILFLLKQNVKQNVSKISSKTQSKL